MKKIVTTLFSVLLLTSAAALALDEVTILPTRKKLDEDKSRPSGPISAKTKEISYTVKVTSRSFAELQGVTVKYNIFYEDSELGSKQAPDVKVISGSEILPTLLTNKPVEFVTKSVELTQQALDPGWYFAGGAKSTSRDKVVGLWFKAFNAEGKQIGEYANPTTVQKKLKWKE